MHEDWKNKKSELILYFIIFVLQIIYFKDYKEGYLLVVAGAALSLHN